MDSISPERRAVWVEILTKAYVALMREMPDAKRLKAIILAFEEINAEIPTDLLRVAYEASMQMNAGSYWDARSMYAAYQANCEHWARERTQAIAELPTATASTVQECLRCYGTGMETIFNEAGERVGARPNCDHLPN